MEKILVVDDLPDNRKLLAYHLHDLGYAVITASGGREALEQAEMERPDLMLLDILMPDLDGIEVCRQMKTHPTLKTIPVLLVSALNAEEDVIRGLDAGAHDYIPKPFHPDILTARVRAALRVKAADEAKANFLATISHELRTPMNGICGANALLMETDLSAEQHELADMINTSAATLLAIIEDLLDTSKMDAGKMALATTPFDLREVVAGAVECVTIQAAEKGLELIVRYAPDTPAQFIGDPNRLRQVLTNLVGNAVKFTDHGHVLLTVECQGQTPETATLYLSVEDTGIGIPEGMQAQIFEKFVQGDGSNTRQYGGAGLGLAITKQLITLMGGHIGVTSSPGAGTTFWCTLELARDGHGEGESEATPGLAQARILVADTHPIVRRVLHEQLLAWGIRANVVDTGEAAVQELRTAYATGNPYHIAVLAADLPDKEGETLVQTIRTDPACRDTLLLGLLAIGQRGDASQTTDARFAATLTKPVHQRALRDTLRRVWESRTPDPRLQDYAKHQASASAYTTAGEVDPIALAHVLGARVLVAEDNSMNQKVVTLMLEKLGCQVDLAENGKQAVELIAHGGYDLVFMDCQMPEMNGFEATRAIRSTAPQRLPIIALTADAKPAVREQCLSVGMDDYLTKPVVPHDLRQVLTRWLAPPAEESMEQLDDSASASPIFDLTRALENASGDRKRLAKLISDVLRLSPRLLADLKEAVTKQDMSQIVFHAHALKDAVEPFGAAEVCAATVSLVESGHQADIREVEEGTRQLEYVLARLRRHLVALQSGTALKVAA